MGARLRRREGSARPRASGAVRAACGARRPGAYLGRGRLELRARRGGLVGEQRGARADGSLVLTFQSADRAPRVLCAVHQRLHARAHVGPSVTSAGAPHLVEHCVEHRGLFGLLLRVLLFRLGRRSAPQPIGERGAALSEHRHAQPRLERGAALGRRAERLHLVVEIVELRDEDARARAQGAHHASRVSVARRLAFRREQRRLRFARRAQLVRAGAPLLGEHGESALLCEQLRYGRLGRVVTIVPGRGRQARPRRGHGPCP